MTVRLFQPLRRLMGRDGEVWRSAVSPRQKSPTPPTFPDRKGQPHHLRLAGPNLTWVRSGRRSGRQDQSGKGGADQLAIEAPFG